MRRLENILVTGGAGFIGSNFIRYIFGIDEFKGKIVNVDKLTYAGNLESIADISKSFGGSRYFFEHADICDNKKMEEVFLKYNIDTVVHFAAESHVDRSISGPAEFINTNILGTFSLLEVCRKLWTGKTDVLFHHVSTDEVYGSLGDEGYFFEDTAYDPRSPYSASKAGSDHLVNAYHHTYGLPVTISNCSNNYGLYQFPEKLIPLMIFNMIEGKQLPVYGDGTNVRDWLYVIDHVSAIWSIVSQSRTGEVYNIGGENECKNIDLVNILCEIVAAETGKEKDFYKQYITFIKDRPGHDKRYAINCDKIKKEFGWSQSVTFNDGLRTTVRWYLENSEWISNIKSGDYLKWIDNNYKNR